MQNHLIKYRRTWNKRKAIQEIAQRGLIMTLKISYIEDSYNIIRLVEKILFVELTA